MTQTQYTGQETKKEIVTQDIQFSYQYPDEVKRKYMLFNFDSTW